ncbi:hypothetical protein Y1Q_0024096 [Alligator mississippiensis]|uniref:Uncharacterized protein n=1 Tax=Alligator mississippiensis TaxID=8496 RepID=A0A151NHQ4_ALLMI|nr:hypothetical protein Y1Q_0024096 [Alligator mississippiensis]
MQDLPAPNNHGPSLHWTLPKIHKKQNSSRTLPRMHKPETNPRKDTPPTPSAEATFPPPKMISTPTGSHSMKHRGPACPQ